MQEGLNTHYPEKNGTAENITKNKDYEVIVEKYQKVARYAALAGAIAVTAYAGKEVYAEHDSVLEHEAYITSMFSEEEFDEYRTLKNTLEEKYGEATLERLVSGDRAAFQEQGIERPKASFTGFENNSELGEVANIDFYPDYVFTESFGMYPAGWIDGEITKVVIKNGNETTEEDGNIIAGSHNPENSFIIIYNVSDRVSDSSQFQAVLFHEYMEKTFAHETAHANDWETKQGLNILERAQLLSKVTDRMSSDTAYSAKTLADGSDYWRSYDDGSEAGLRKMAKEYWAEICAAYFTETRSFQSENPEDFALVQEIVTKSDSDFDILDSERGARNQWTGQLHEKWSADLQRLKGKQ